jgi:hypothetical protein
LNAGLECFSAILVLMRAYQVKRNDLDQISKGTELGLANGTIRRLAGCAWWVSFL